MKNKLDINLIHRYLSGECSAKEKQRILKWIDTDPEIRDAVQALRKIWEIEPRKEMEIDVQMAWRQLEEHLNEAEQSSIEGQPKNTKHRLHHVRSKKKQSFMMTWMRVAAVLLLALLLTFFFVDFRENATHTEEITEVMMREVVAKRAHQAQVTFSDGSYVILNSDSRIRFPERFDANVREVYLEGEAYFEVTQTSGVEFIVQTNDTRVKVLGTKFNVKDRPEDETAEVVVSEGKVSVQSIISDLENETEEVILTRGQISTVNRGQAPSSPRTIDLNNYMTWLRGDFVFQKEPLSRVFEELERRFDVDIVVEDTTLLSTFFTGEFRNEPLDEILKLASQSLEFSYERDDRIISIKNHSPDE